MNRVLIVVLIVTGVVFISWLTAIPVKQETAAETTQETPRPAASPSKSPTPRFASTSTGSSSGAATPTAPVTRTAATLAFKTVPLNKAADQVRAWQDRAARDRARAREAARRERPVGVGPLDPAADRDQLQQWYEQAQVDMARKGYLHTLPTEKQEQYVTRINTLLHDIKYSPDRPDLYLDLAHVQAEVHMDGAVADTLYQAYNRFPDDPKVLLERGRYYHGYGYRRQAEEMYQKLLGLQPDNQEVRDALQQAQATLDYLPGMDPAGNPAGDGGSSKAR